MSIISRLIYYIRSIYFCLTMCLCESQSGISLQSRSVYAQLFILDLLNLWLKYVSFSCTWITSVATPISIYRRDVSREWNQFDEKKRVNIGGTCGAYWLQIINKGYTKWVYRYIDVNFILLGLGLLKPMFINIINDTFRYILFSQCIIHKGFKR